MPNACVVADLGGTFLRCALIGADDSITAIERMRLPGDARSRSETIWEDIVEAIARYIERYAAAILPSIPIAFAFPGPILGDSIVSAAPTVLGGSAALPDIRTLLAGRTRRDVIMLNDVSAAAWYFGERVFANRFAVVTVSSGIGAKIYDRRHPLGVLDDALCAGEIGHLVVDDDLDARICDCGGRGHLGAIASARGFEQTAQSAARRDVRGFASSACSVMFGATAMSLTNEAHLVPALRAGDSWSIALLDSAVRPLAGVLRTLCVGFGLDAIVLMGGFAQAVGEMYRIRVERAVGMLSDAGPAHAALRNGIILAGPHEEPSLVGAAVYARNSRLVS